MWFKLAGADFSKNNLGTMSSISSSYLIDYTGLTGMSGSPSSVSYAGSDAGTSKSVTVTVTVTSGYTFKNGSTISASGGKTGTVFTAQQDYTGGNTFTFNMDVNANTKLTGVAEATGGSSSGGNTGGSGGDSNGDDSTTTGTLITSGSLTGAYLYENSQFDGHSTTIIPDTSNTYFVIEAIPVEGNTEYVLAKGRACWFLNSSKTPIAPTASDYVNLTSGYTNFTFTTPATCAYITVAFKYADIQPANVVLIKNSFGEPTTTLLKDTGATYMAETGVMSQSSNPDTYTEPQPITGWFTYHLIPVTGGNKYKMEKCRLSNWYDADKQFISQVNFNSNTTNPTTPDWSHVAPANAAYLTICVNNNDSTKDTIAMIEYPKV